MKRIALFLTDKEIAALKKLARKSGLSASELIRRAIDVFLKREAK